MSIHEDHAGHPSTLWQMQMQHKWRNYSGKVTQHDYEELEYHEVCEGWVPRCLMENTKMDIMRLLFHIVNCVKKEMTSTVTVTHECTTSVLSEDELVSSVNA